jgi:hypothetical protein
MTMTNQNSRNEEKENMQARQSAHSLGLNPKEQEMNGNYGMVETDAEDAGSLHDEGQRNQSYKQ